MSAMRLFGTTAVALVAFASNSILCRQALRATAIDAASFTAVRLAAGAVTLVLLSTLIRHPGSASATRATDEKPFRRVGGTWTSAFALSAYAVAFSLAYLSLTAGTGALILFGAVQTTIMVVALQRGERAGALEWTGIATAVAGFVYLVLPGLSAPPLAGSLLMTLAGISWGVYTLRGRGVSDAVRANTGNFLRSVPLVVAVVPLAVWAGHHAHVSPAGTVLAVLSGIASGLGYVVWYAVVRTISSIGAATVQLAVPVLAAAGGVLLLDERLTFRLVVSAVLILGGIATAACAPASTRRIAAPAVSATSSDS